MLSDTPDLSTLEEFLRFDPTSASSLALYAPAADWTQESQYPPYKLPDEYTRADYLRLAWELLRRMPRYRRQHRKLGELGIDSPTFGRGAQSTHFTHLRPPAFPGWRKVPLRGHKCEPRLVGQDMTLGEYVDRHGDSDLPWFVMNRRKWVMDFWGLAAVPDPAAHYEHFAEQGVFVSPAAVMTPISEAQPGDQPQAFSTFVRTNEVLVRLRLDVSFDQQISAIQYAFVHAQRVASTRPRNLNDPLPEPGRRKPGKIAMDDTDQAPSDRARAKAGRVLLKQLELAPLWLRTWDALAQARLEQGKLNPRLDRDHLVHKFILSRPAFDAEEGTPRGSGARRRKSPLGLDHILKKALSPAMVPNWRDRGQKYIEQSDEAYRQLVALAFAKA